MKKINVPNEIAPLKKVLVHRPGKELLNLTPDTLDRLLFDDIPYLKVAQQEHDAFAEIMRNNGVEVVYLEDLMAETLAHNAGLREQFLHQFIAEAGVASDKYEQLVYDYLIQIPDDKEFVLKTMEGVNRDELKHDNEELSDFVDDDKQLVLDPLPNLYFTRDPFASVGDGIVLNKMYSVTRNRETIYADYIFRYHPEYKGTIEFLYNRTNKHHIEGGDVLNISEKVLAVGISQRTESDAIEQLAKNLFFHTKSAIETVLAIVIPNNRAMMHLDTVFTQIDVDKFTVHPGIMGTLKVFELTKGSAPDELHIVEIEDTLEHILAKYLGIDKVELILCGGGDKIIAEREQWNDGSNTLAIAPGVIIVYDRNDVTNQILRDKGITVLEMPSYELSRGRGGPRCMSMPLVREK